MKSARQKFPIEDLQEWVKRCDPTAPADPEGDLYYPLEQGDLRGRTRLEDILRPIRLNPDKSCQLFSGFSGTGKSTELLRVKRDLEKRGFVVLLVDALDYLTLSRPLEIEDLLVAIAGAFDDATAQLVPTGEPSFWEKLLRVLRSELQLISVGARFEVIDLKFSVKHGNSFWQDARKRLAMSPGRMERDAHGQIQECIGRLEDQFPKTKGVVFIVDSLEKLRGSIGEFRELLKSAVDTFTDYSEALHLPKCHVIYTVPPYLPLLQPGLKGLYDEVSEELPAIKVDEFNEATPFKPKPHKAGIVALRELVGKRVPLDRFFGQDLRHLDNLIRHSGGHVRTLVAMIRDVIYRLDELGGPVTGADVKDIIASHREPAILGLGEEQMLLLYRIQIDASLKGIIQDNLPVVAELMDRRSVLCYRNGEGWYLINPLVRETVFKYFEAPPPRVPGF